MAIPPGYADSTTHQLKIGLDGTYDSEITPPTIPPVPTPPAIPAPSSIPIKLSFNNYSYVKSHVIMGSPDGALADYQVKLTIHSGTGTDNGQDVYLNGHSLSWPNDIRFTGQDGTPLGFWIESYDANTATIWVRIRNMPGSPGLATINMYYGRSGDAGASSGTATFPFFEDWSAYMIGKNVRGQGGWSVERLGGKGAAEIRSDGGANVLFLSSSTPDNSVIAHDFPLQNNQAYLYRTKKLSGSDNLQFEACDGDFISNGAMQNGYDVVYGGYGQAYTMIRKFENGSEADIARVPDNTGDTSYHTYEWAWSGDNFSARRDGIELTSGRDSTWASRDTIALSMYQANSYCSYVLVRNYTMNEPVNGPWGTESQMLPAPVKLSGYAYEKACRIIGSPDGDLTDYQLKFIVHKGSGADGSGDVYLNGHSQSWPNDIRFTDSLDYPLSFWVESYDSSTAVVWVKVDKITSEGTDIKLHYGKANDAGASDGDSTFLAFDHFTGYSLDTDKWNFSGYGSFTVIHSAIRLTDYSDIVMIQYRSGIPVPRYVIETSGTVVSPYDRIKYRPGVLFLQGASPDSAALGFDTWAFDDDGWCVFDYPRWSWRKTTGPAEISPSDPYDGRFRLKVIVNDGTYSCQEALRYKTINGNSGLTGTSFSLIAEKCTDDYDWVFVRQYTPDEPAPGYWNGEVRHTSAGTGWPALSGLDIAILGAIGIMLILIVVLVLALGAMVLMASKHK